MYLPLLRLRAWDEFNVEERKISLQAQLESLITHNILYLKRHPGLPEITSFNLKYVMKKRPNDVDDWWDIPECVARSGGDCKDFSAWMVAWYRFHSIADVYPWITDHVYDDPSGNGPPVTLYHVRVRVHEQILDPSAWFGMPTVVSYDELRT